ncbi:bcl-2-related ovarian killer protein-like [Ptychodera flava]|uniref:bcl-2-related ovarian killer protein-like n=1 Tax=Ptychodera flava TaxID=63121 RepID=UPI003969F49F
MEHLEPVKEFFQQISDHPIFRKTPEDEEAIVDQSITLCRDYINFKLAQGGLIHKRGTGPELDNFSEVSAHIIVTGFQLEQFHPSVYKDVCRKLHLNLSSDAVISDAVHEVANELFRGGINWPRIISLFVFTGALASECVASYHPDYVHTVTTSFRDVVERRLATWVLQRGGWVDVVTTVDGFRYNHSLRVQSIISAAVGFLVALLLTGTT